MSGSTADVSCDANGCDGCIKQTGGDDNTASAAGARARIDVAQSNGTPISMTPFAFAAGFIFKIGSDDRLGRL